MRIEDISVISKLNISSKTFDTLNRSLKYTKNNRGPKVEPWGAPQVISSNGKL